MTGIELLICGPEGHSFFTRWEFSVIHDEAQKPCSIQCIGTDITVEKNLLESEARKSAILASSLDAIIIIDINNTIVEWNTAAERIFGYKPEEAIGKKIADLIIPQRYRKFHLNGMERLIKTDEAPLIGKLVEITALRKDGTEFPSELYISMITIEGKSLFTGTLRDITERKESEKTIHESEQRFREVADSAPVMIWMSDEDNKTTYLNRPWINFTGICAKELDRAGWASVIHRDDVEDTIKEYNKSFQCRKPVKLVFRLRDKSGDYRWVLESGMPRYLEDGSFLGYTGSLVDINDQKIKEEQLLYQATILENVTDVIVITDLNFSITSWNSVAEEFYGMKSDDVLGLPFQDVVKFPGSFSEKTRRHITEKGYWKGELSFINAIGEKKYLLNTTSFVNDNEGKKIGIMSVGRDITKRKKAEEKLEQSELFYRHLIGDSLDGILLTDSNGIMSFGSPSVKNILGLESKEIIGKNIFQFVHPEDVKFAEESFQRRLSDNPEIKLTVIRLLKKDGEWLWCMVRANNQLHNPHINAIVVYFHDNTLRKTAEDALKESEGRFRNLIINLQIGILLLNGANEGVLCNKAALALLDINEKDIIGKKVNEDQLNYLNEDGSPLPFDLHPRNIAASTKKFVRDVVLRVHRKKKNDQICLIVNADPFLDENNELVYVICSFVDITERKKLEQKLIEQEIGKQKLLVRATIEGQEKERREIGKELHDNIGQQLTTTKLYLDIAQNSSPDISTAETIMMASKYVSGLIDEVRRLSRSLVPSTLGDIGLTESITELIDSVRPTQSFQIYFNHQQFNDEVLTEEQKLMLFRITQEQINNIIKHANAENVNIWIQTEDDNVVMEIIDDGKGFDMADVKRGLGLTNIMNRAELFNGRANIVASPDKGCTVTVTVPLLQSNKIRA